MAKVLKLLYSELYYYVVECKDKRIEDYFLLGSPLKILSVAGLYLYFIYEFGPKFMKKREPFQLNKILMIYNLFQVITNVILGSFIIYAFYRQRNSLHCVPIEYGNDYDGLLQVNLSYCYYLLKVIDLFDTIFFVLRKKYNQITFLHVYHHVGMAIASYIFTVYMPGGHYGYLPLYNCFVHAVMYTYYFLTAFKPELKQSLWWKKYITQIQMIQFSLIILSFLVPLCFSTNCKVPFFWLYVAIIQNGFMLILFGDFYIKAYIKKPKKSIKIN